MSKIKKQRQQFIQIMYKFENTFTWNVHFDIFILFTLNISYGKRQLAKLLIYELVLIEKYLLSYVRTYSFTCLI